MRMKLLEGAVMETRCGDFDPGSPPYIMQKMNLSAREQEQILNNKSGIFGLIGRHMARQHFFEGSPHGDSRCRLALEIGTSLIRKYIGSYLAAVELLDAIVFSTGCGTPEWSVREMVLNGFDCFGISPERVRNRTIGSELKEVEISAADSRIRVFVIPNNEELVLSEGASAINSGGSHDHLHYDYSFACGDFAPSVSLV